LKLNSDVIKAGMAAHYRYKEQCPLVALEAHCFLETWGGELADLLILTKGRRLIEVEVKCSLADLRQDRFKSKHRQFRDGYGGTPTQRFYFAVPKEIANKAVRVCDQFFPYAGIWGVSAEKGAYSNVPGWSFFVESYRHPKVLSGERLTVKQLVQMAREQSGTVCRLAKYKALTEYGMD